METGRRGEVPRVGVFICHCGTNIAQTVDVESVAEFAKSLPDVVVSMTNKYMCSDPGQDAIKKAVKEHKLNRVVVAACSPRMHEPTFREVLRDAGLNPYLFEMANIREQDSWVHMDRDSATTKAKALVAGAVFRARYLQALEGKEFPIVKDVLIVGGGIAGIQAALEIANAGYHVYLVERGPSLGGHMIQLDKTFPTLDCSACILTPKMSEAGRHKNIKILTLSEVLSVDGSVGNFKVKVRKKARYVNEEECTACGDCAKVCPVIVPDEFNYGLSSRRAIYQPFPQAVPASFLINMDDCLGNRPIACEKCAAACEKKCINLLMQDEVLELNVGFIVLATGYDLLDITQLPQYGWGRFPNVLHSLEFERMINASGPTGGKILRMDNLDGARSFAILHCIGSRDSNYAPYCSRVCCMYALKFAHIIRERLGEEVEIFSFYIDMRCFGAGYEEFYKRVCEEGVQLIRGKVARILSASEAPPSVEVKRDQLLVQAEDTLLGKMLYVPVDMVILCPAMVPADGTEKLAQMFKVSRRADGFFMERHPKLDPVATLTEGVFIAGCCQSPKDIPDTVAQAAAAASRILALLEVGKVVVEPTIARLDENICTGCRICNLLCPFGAISYDKGLNKSKIDEALCKGCGVCASACPFSAIKMLNFTDEQIMAQIEGVLKSGKKE
ncbi:MAG: CoB--CoM heterodisulfide reductase iron-sulfur subunit A family protein [Planctomycetota bacterium]|nr:CoB--CoM heterodisulfide reductase iron-sulfur subunit A family protein [Planctomycetota bacterium]